MTGCEAALLKIIEEGITVNISRIARLAHVSDGHARRCLNCPDYELSSLTDKFRAPGKPVRIKIRRKETA